MSPTVATLARLVSAMGETMATLCRTPPAPNHRRTHNQRRLMHSRGVLDSQVTPGWATRLEILESLVEPGGGSSGLHTHAGEEECVLVLEGELKLWHDRHHLDVGDSATFRFHTPSVAQPVTEPSRLLVVPPQPLLTAGDALASMGGRPVDGAD